MKISHNSIVAIFVYYFIFTAVTYSQCGNFVNHNNGSQIINQVNTLVSSTGSVSNVSLFGCDDYPMNYVVGMNALDGGYTFNFSPSIENASLNFFRLDNILGNIEEVQLFVNNSHYAIPLPGSAFSECSISIDANPAIITNEGNIRANPSIGSGAMKDLIIPGPIETLTVLGKVISGTPTGSIFSLYICDGILKNNEFEDQAMPALFPNPFSDKCEIRLPTNENWTVTLTDLNGQKIRTFQSSGDTVTIYRENLLCGIYLIQLNNNRQFLNAKLVVKD